MDDLLPDLTLAFNETFQMLSISTVLAILGGLPLGFLIFCHRSSSVLAEPFYLSRRLGSGEYYPLGAICYFTGAVTAANAAFCWAIR
ncbi:methionine ABC transporter permease [Salmonella sp. NCTC 11881]|nr:methionine ABC transporter permease [Salmonella sp. NCTC 11881]